MPERPTHCQPAAFELLRAQLERIETDDGLLAGACAIALHGLHELVVGDVSHQIDEIATSVRRRVRGDDPRALVAHAHDVLFEDLGFHGDTEDYYDPINSYLPCVLERRRGIPITLSLIYKLVLGRLGVAVHGINAPGHFLVRVVTNGTTRPMLVDPFARGRVLTIVEALERIRQVVGPKAELDRDLLPLATHRVWLARMLRNLMNVFHARQRADDHGAMAELHELLTGV